MNFQNKAEFLTDLKIAIVDKKTDVVYQKDEDDQGIITEALQTGTNL